MTNYFLTSAFIIVTTCLSSEAQTPLKHEKKIFVSPDGKIFVNKSLPIYVKISTSPNGNAPSCTLPSETTARYANPMYFDTEGKNTFRSPYAVDTVTKKTVEPKRDIVFDVYVDGEAPATDLKISQARKYIKNGLTYFGKDVKITFQANDRISGTEATFVSIDHSEYTDRTKITPSFDTEKEYVISYYSVDHVGNAEKPKTTSFFVDLTPPKTSFKISGESKGHVLSSRASLVLSAKDSLSGVNRIIYSINDGPEKTYTAPIPLSVLKDGQSKITYYSVDNVGNKEEPRVIATSTEKPDNTNESSPFSFYIDKEPPEVSFEIVGDQSKGKYLYLSPRSQFKINAIDEKSGVNKVTYSINKPLLDQTYTEPITFKGEGLQTVFFAASDNVGNYALAKSQKVFIDRGIPNTALSFGGTVFTNRDTTFITGSTSIILSAASTYSGIKNITYSLDGAAPVSYTGPFSIDKEGFHTIGFEAMNNVNTKEPLKKRSFFVDNTAPVIHYNFSVKAIGEKIVRNEKYTIYPSNTMLYIAATDNASGSAMIEYRINGGPALSFIPIKGFSPGNYEIEIVAYDMLRNKSVETIRFSIEN